MDPQTTVKNNNKVIFPKSNHGYPTISALLGGFFGFCGVDVFDSESEIGSRYRRQKSDESIISADSTSIISDLGKEFKIKCRFPDESSYGSTSSDQDQLISPTSSQSKSLDDFKNLIREADIKFSDRIKHTRNIADGDRGYEKYLLLNELQVQQKVINEITARIETLGGVERFRDNEMTDDFIIRYLDEKRIDQPFKAASLQYDDRQSPQASNLMKIANFSLWFEWHHSIPASMNVIAYAFIHMSAFNVFTSLYWEPFPNSISGNMMMVLFSLFVLQVCGSLFKFKFLGDNRFAGYKIDYRNRMKLGKVGDKIICWYHSWFKHHPIVQHAIYIIMFFVIYTSIEDIMISLDDLIYDKNDFQEISSTLWEGQESDMEMKSFQLISHYISCEQNAICYDNEILSKVRYQIEVDAVEDYISGEGYDFLVHLFGKKIVAFPSAICYAFFSILYLRYMKINIFEEN